MFGLPLLSTRSQSLRTHPLGMRTAGLVGAAMLFATLGSAQEKLSADSHFGATFGWPMEVAASPAESLPAPRLRRRARGRSRCR